MWKLCRHPRVENQNCNLISDVNQLLPDSKTLFDLGINRNRFINLLHERIAS